MADRITTRHVHHLRLTVTDVPRSVEFYTQVLNFDVVGQFGVSTLISNGEMVLGLGPSSDPSKAIPDDRFDENRVGLDHLSFAVGSRDELEKAMRLLDDRSLPHGEMSDLGEEIGFYILAFRDPDNIQLELTAPRA